MIKLRIPIYIFALGLISGVALIMAGVLLDYYL
ncbi:hypothetical protein FHR85_000308 [Alkalibacillus almallahensis]|nr:hypothetical protein [Alkalibacillus almallahensis]